MNELEQYLAVAGFSPRKAQTDLYEHLIRADRRGVISQAGTGTGKSAAIIAAAANRARATGRQSIIVTPTLTLMNQYRDGDVPLARKAYDDLEITELRGRAHYFCEIAEASADVIGAEYVIGCEGSEGGCKEVDWAGADALGLPAYRCDYQAAKNGSRTANIVVTNADMLIVNDRMLTEFEAEIFELDGSLYVDEAHTLEQKLRDWASRSLWHKSIERFNFAGTSAPRLADWLKERAPVGVNLTDLPPTQMGYLRDIAFATVPDPKPKDGLAKQRETQEACIRILKFLQDPHDSAVLHVSESMDGERSLKMDWINIAQSAGELLSARDFGLVSATVPRSMAASLGVASAPFIDVGHPFDYGTQAWIGFSAYGGSYREAQHDSNFEIRAEEVKKLLLRSKGGALLLFSSFRDLERLWDHLEYDLQTHGITVLKQERGMEAADRQALADAFKADGNAVLFGSESFATGFDVPGEALRLVVVWKLPYPAVDPVSNAIRASSWARYEDLMKVRAVQAIGRLIRRESDRGVVWVADERGRKLLDPSDPLTSHIPQFARL